MEGEARRQELQDRESIFFIIYKILLLILFINSMHPWYIWNSSIDRLTVALTVLSSFFFIFDSKSFKNLERDALLLLLLGLFTLLKCFKVNINGSIQYFALFIIWCGILCLDNKERLSCINFITKWFSIILLISLFAYLLNLFKLWPFSPTQITYEGVGYRAANYKLFLIQLDTRIEFTRFMSVFAEPGHMTMGAVPLIIINKFNLRNKYVIFLLLAEIWSFSLAGYITLFIGYLLFHFNKRILKGLVGLSILCCVTYGGMEALGYGDVLRVFIWDRVQIENGELAGNNRFKNNVNQKFEQLSHSSEILWGYPHADSVIRGSSGYKVFVLQNGLIGLFLIMGVYIFYWVKYKSYYSFVVLVIFSLLFLQNGYPTWMCMLGTYLLGMPLMCRNRLEQT